MMDTRVGRVIAAMITLNLEVTDPLYQQTSLFNATKVLTIIS